MKEHDTQAPCIIATGEGRQRQSSWKIDVAASSLRDGSLAHGTDIACKIDAE